MQWLKRETIATLGMIGAALSVLAQLAGVVPFMPWLKSLLEYWSWATHSFWRPPFRVVGVPLHHDMIAALTVVTFLIMIGVGARISRRLRGVPLRPMSFAGWLDDQTWSSVIVFAAVCMAFLLGHGASHSDPLVAFGSREAGKYAFALTVSFGYFAGDFIGQQEFHRRLLRLAVLVTALLAVDLAAVLLA